MDRPWLHRYAVLLVVCSVLLVMTGTGVTDNEERPLYSIGQNHALAGTAVGLLMIVLVIWMTSVEPRAWLRLLAWLAFGTVIVEALLGRQTPPLSPTVRVSHSLIAHLFVATMVAIAWFTSRAWKRQPELVKDRPPLRFLAKITPALVLAQIMLGAMHRHGIIDVTLHLFAGLIVAFVILGLTLPVTNRPEFRGLHSSGMALLVITSAQVFLGLALFSMASMDIDPMAVIVVTMIHTAAGASTLSASVVMATVVGRNVRAAGNS